MKQKLFTKENIYKSAEISNQQQRRTVGLPYTTKPFKWVKNNNRRWYEFWKPRFKRVEL